MRVTAGRTYTLRNGARVRITGERTFRSGGVSLRMLAGYMLGNFALAYWMPDGRFSPADGQPEHELDIVQ